MRVAIGTLLVSAACLLGGCGTSERAQVQAKVEQFERAVLAKDYRTICQQVLAPVLLAHLAAGGYGCEQAMQIALQGVHSPSLSIGKITISGSRATAITLTSAKGQFASLDAIELVKTGAGWRVASLGSPVKG